MSAPHVLRYRNSHSLGIRKNVVVPETQDAIAIALNDRRTIRIRRLVVLTSIGFDDEFGAMACEIRKILPDRHLLSKANIRKSFAKETP